VPTRILLVRHGETDWNAERRWQGHSDRTLNELGRRQAEELAAQLGGARIDAVYSSDLVRAHETARILAQRRGLDVTAVPGLRERRFGSFEGLRDEEVAHRFPGLHTAPDAETREEMADRVWTALERIARAHPDGTILVVAHGGPIRAILRHLQDIRCEEPVQNCAILELDVDVH
jgi:broad specificity phosphatase PhoE